MSFSIRVCRHCSKPVSLHDSVCAHCKGKLMSPKAFALTLWVMAIVLFLAFTAVAYGAVKVKMAKDALHERSYCEKTMYARDFVGPEEGCLTLCTNTCQKNGLTSGNGVPISTVQHADRVDIEISCACACDGCFLR